jgi:hypothetical protein
VARQYFWLVTITQTQNLSSPESFRTIPHLEGRLKLAWLINLGNFATSSSESFFPHLPHSIDPRLQLDWATQTVLASVYYDSRNNTSHTNQSRLHFRSPPLQAPKVRCVDRILRWSICRRNCCNKYVASSIAATYLAFLLSTKSAGQLQDCTSFVQSLSPSPHQQRSKLVLSAGMMC